MSFWAYMLHCRGGMFYIGHTDNLPHRIGQHESGAIPGFTADRLPVTLVWNQEFSTRYEALEAERRIKGWSRAKKMALIRGDWHQISTLAKSKNSPSTSSGRTEKKAAMSHTPATVCPELVEGLSLICHPDTPSSAIERIEVTIDWLPKAAPIVVFAAVGVIDAIVLPPPSEPRFEDELWRNTCFEVFSKGIDATCYDELNLSPSGEWATYGFLSYREGMDRLRTAPPDIQLSADAHRLQLIARAALSNFGPPWQIGLSAVIEEVDGTKSYWALRHPPGKPDFHHPDCFALTLGAPPAA